MLSPRDIHLRDDIEGKSYLINHTQIKYASQICPRRGAPRRSNGLNNFTLLIF
jgi:hypothetical protein